MPDEPTTDLYFECHITVEPVFGEQLETLKQVVAPFGFRVADLLMRKRLEDAPERSQYDTFCTSRSENYRDLEHRMNECLSAILNAGYVFWRYKIENTLLDRRYGD